MFELRLLGGAVVEGPEGPLTGRIAQRRQLALLAFLALHDRPVSRDKIIGILWPELPTDRARHSLSDATYAIRRELGDGAIRSIADELQLDDTVVASDTGRFRRALAAGRHEEALSLYTGPLLDGFHLGGAPEFEHWLEREQARLAIAAIEAAETLAVRHEQAGDQRGAARWWREAVVIDPHSSRLALRLVRALATAGDPAAAVRAARTHATLLEADLGIKPPQEFVDVIAHVESAASRVTSPDPITASAQKTVSSGEPHAVPRIEPNPAPAHRSMHRRRFVPAAMVAVVGIGAWYGLSGEPPGRANASFLDTGLVAVVPFRVTGPGAAQAPVGEGVVDLLSAKLTGQGGTLRAVPPSDVIAAWTGVVHRVGADVPRDSALALARAVGAGRLIVGSVVTGAARLSVQAGLLDTRTGDVIGNASANGEADDLVAMLDRLAIELLGRNAGVEERNLAYLTSAVPAAIYPFLAGRAAQRRGDYGAALHEFNRALGLDSSFALAGLGIVDVAGWVGGSEPIRRRGARARALGSDRLAERDRPFEGLLRDSDAPLTGRLQLERIETALSRWPDSQRFWYLRGDKYMHLGGSIDPANSARQARLSFERAIELDSAYANAIHHLVTVLAELGDSAALRVTVEQEISRRPTGPVADYLRWYARHTLGDPAFDVPPIESMDTDVTLRWIGIVAQDYGFGIEDGREAIQVRMQRAGIEAERRERVMGSIAYAVNSGRPSELAALLDELSGVQPDPDYASRITILTALHADGDTALARRSARALATSEAGGRLRELNQCVLTQWQLRDSDAEVPPPDILSDDDAVSRDTAPHALHRRICNLVRDALWLEREAGPAWHAAIDRLDRLMDMVPITGLVDDGEEEYAHLVLARMQVRTGQPEAALRSLDRRTRYNGWQPYLAGMLELEGRLALDQGDTARAVRAWSHYLAFRTDPEPVVAAAVERVTTAMAGLGQTHAQRAEGSTERATARTSTSR